MENNVENNVNVEENAAPANGFVNKVKDGAGDFAGKIKADPKGFGVKVGAIVLAAIIVIVGLFVGVGAATNNYKTPLKTAVKQMNTKKYVDNYDELVADYNGFCKKEIKALAKLMEKSEDYEDDLEKSKEYFEEYIEEQKDEYGSNYKYSFKVIEKEKLDDKDLREYKDRLDATADTYKAWLEAYDEYTSDDWKDMADRMGFDGDKSLAKKYVDILKDVREKYKKAKITAGYELEVELTLKGSELDEPETEESTIVVLKVDGHWVMTSVLYGFMGQY